MHYLLVYEAGPDFLERRAAYRSAHLALAREAVARGELVLAGAVGQPPEGSVLLFVGESPEAAERFAAADPYVQHGLVTSWRVREWATVVGSGAQVALPPGI